jgi:hypothetical protein
MSEHHSHHNGHRKDSTTEFRNYMFRRSKRNKMMEKVLFAFTCLVALIVVGLLIMSILFDR